MLVQLGHVVYLFPTGRAVLLDYKEQLDRVYNRYQTVLSGARPESDDITWSSYTAQQEQLLAHPPQLPVLDAQTLAASIVPLDAIKASAAVKLPHCSST